MTVRERNPYVILGVDYGCTLDEARKAFVRVVRRIRSKGMAEFTEEDLTSALHSIEQVIRDPDSAVDVYRIPSDASVFEVANHGLLGTSPRPLGRQSPPLSDEEFDRIVSVTGRRRLMALSNGLRDDVKSLTRDPYRGE